MRKCLFFIIVLVNSWYCFAQNSIDELLQQYNDDSIPYILPDTLHNTTNNVILLDSREKKEYKASHIKNAIHVGYNHFNINKISKQNLNKDATIVVYCSLGIRSQEIAKKLKDSGYSNVHNLYGGIFEWKNKNYPVINIEGKPTEKVHTYSKEWSKWLSKGKKVY